VLPVVEPVVAGERDDGVLQQAFPLQMSENPPYALIYGR